MSAWVVVAPTQIAKCANGIADARMTWGSEYHLTYMKSSERANKSQSRITSANLCIRGEIADGLSGFAASHVARAEDDIPANTPCD